MQDERESSERIPSGHRQDSLWAIPGQANPSLVGGPTSGVTRAVGAGDGQDGHGGDGAKDGGAVTVGLARLAELYLSAKRNQERDHTDELLNWRRTEAHDAFLAGLAVAGIEYRDREHGAQIASAMDGLVGLARTFVEADRARWASMVKPPLNGGKGKEHWDLVEVASVAWVAWVTALAAHGIEVMDRRGLAVELAR